MYVKKRGSRLKHQEISYWYFWQLKNEWNFFDGRESNPRSAPLPLHWESDLKLCSFFSGMKILVEFVPNHSSNKHDWFIKSAQKIDPYTNYYVWKDGLNGKPGTPPNNWVSWWTSLYLLLLCVPNKTKGDVKGEIPISLLSKVQPFDEIQNDLQIGNTS